MDLLQNPFYILTATQRDNRRRIIDLAEQRSLLADADACLEAQAALINPRRRISAEVAWLPGVAPERAYDMLMLLELSAGNHRRSRDGMSIESVGSLAVALSPLPNAQTYNVADLVLESIKDGGSTLIEKFLGIDKLHPVARTNLLIARMARLPDDNPDRIAKWILAIAQAFEIINPEDVRTTLNKERSVSGFPEIMDMSVIEAEIQNRRLYYQQVIKSVLENISIAKARVRPITIVLSVVASATDNGENHWSILIEDTLDSYEVAAQGSLETIEKNIETQYEKIQIAADAKKSDTLLAPMVDELIHIVKDWRIIAEPIVLKKNRQGLRYEVSHRIANRVRQLAVHLFNEYDKLDFSQQILNMLREIFDSVPDIAERITADLDTLNKIVKQRKWDYNDL